VERLDGELLDESLELLSRFTHAGIGGRDAPILATMARHRAKRILTHDDAFARVPGVEVVDRLPGVRR
jgi:predicted nucleic acid-binding protein